VTFDWSEYLDLAEEPAARPEEAAHRSAISRAYYTALGKAREFLETESESFTPSDNLHSVVWQAFTVSTDDRRYYIGIDGRWLRLNRNASDYESGMTDPKGRAAQAVRKAREVLDTLERLIA
jgi:hypothetical protein